MLPVILENVPQFEFLGCFLINRLRLCIFDKKQYRNDAVPFIFGGSKLYVSLLVMLILITAVMVQSPWFL